MNRQNRFLYYIYLLFIFQFFPFFLDILDFFNLLILYYFYINFFENSLNYIEYIIDYFMKFNSYSILNYFIFYLITYQLCSIFLMNIYLHQIWYCRFINYFTILWIATIYYKYIISIIFHHKVKKIIFLLMYLKKFSKLISIVDQNI